MKTKDVLLCWELKKKKIATLHDCSFFCCFFSMLAGYAIIFFTHQVPSEVFVTVSFKWEWWTFVLMASWAALGKCPLSAVPCERPKKNTSEIWRSVQMKGPLVRGEEKNGGLLVAAHLKNTSNRKETRSLWILMKLIDSCCKQKLGRPQQTLAAQSAESYIHFN